MAIRKWSGILGNDKATKLVNLSDPKPGVHIAQGAINEADCIVTAMILGLCREYVGGKKTLILTAEHEKEKDLEKLKSAVGSINSALATLNIDNLPPVKYGYAPKYIKKIDKNKHKETYITGKAHGAGLPSSMMKDHVELDTTTKEWLVDELAAVPEEGRQLLYTGRGAYTGVHTVKDKRKFWGSSFRHYVPETSDRWVPKKGYVAWPKNTKDKHIQPWGLIAGLSSIVGMEEFGDLDEDPEGVVGYTHGMIQAIYSAAAHGFKGKTIEIASGKVTTKMASCFACTTFMCATSRPPDAIHLGRGESWVPIYPESDGCKVLTDRVTSKKGSLDKMKSATKYLNDKWHNKCSIWLYWGTTISNDCVNKSHKQAWDRVKKFAAANKKKGAKSANLFLDALTVHCSDVDRVKRTLT